ncbi:hypothetical protein LTR56_007099 [Elasticomyces elasticus]|nr:hypothetical protein LTR56_007099 [Elasticomyces elasticus]KAK3652075.1 hypothetical protein LTR22_011864 [Elasticomyces elasticus]KAK4917833.1 hypothetical protein LTR49_014370 [Elasticomyces elasticus]KAK5750505.1 hypothetical protein LTS12_019463 [Elasticomyces elasticus]
MIFPTIAVLIAAVLYPYSYAITGVSAADLLQHLYERPVLQVASTVEPPDGSTLIVAKEEWDIRYHTGGNSPWIPKINGTIAGGIDPPLGCRIDQVHMMARHAERYPTTLSGIRMLELFQHIQHANVTLQGDLDFANDWDFFMRDLEHLENLVATGPNAGTLGAFETGVKLRTRYEHLLEEALSRNQTNFWASDSKRVRETAGYFGAGFFGLDWRDTARLHVISEAEDRGGDTLTPGKTCFKYANNADGHGHAYGVRIWSQWRESYMPAIVERLSRTGIRFSESEVYSMQELCGFELIAKGSSKWCDVFTHEEWEQFEYARDVLHYYRTGPGTPYSATMGWLWLNATADLLREGAAEAGPLFFSFVHDGDIIPMLAALDLLPDQVDLPVSHLPANRTFRTSDIVPMGGRIIFERLACPAAQACWNKADYGYPNMVFCEPYDAGKEDYFVRINVNDGIMALAGCDSGPGGSCPLAEFMQRAKERGDYAGDFRKTCGLPKDAKGGISFLHQ